MLLSVGKHLGLGLRFLYGYLKGFNMIAVIYIVIAFIVIIFDPQEFTFYIIQYIKTDGYSRLKITWLGHLIMVLYGFIEWLKCKNEMKEKKGRKKIYE